MDSTEFQLNLQKATFLVLSSGKNKIHNDTTTLLDSRSSGMKNQNAINVSTMNMLADIGGYKSSMVSKSNFRSVRLLKSHRSMSD